MFGAVVVDVIESNIVARMGKSMAKKKPAEAIEAEAGAVATLEPPDDAPEPQEAPSPKTIWELVQDFYEAVANHPDARVLAADFDSRPGRHEMFQDATREAQRIVYLRFLMRWPHKG